DIDTAVSQWRASIDQSSLSSWRFLKNLAWDPIGAALSGVTRVWVSSDGQLSSIPWQLFALDEQLSGGPAPGFSSLQVDSAREFIRRAGRGFAETAPPKKSILVLSGLDYGPEATKDQPKGECWHALPETRSEGEMVAELFGPAGYSADWIQDEQA